MFADQALASLRIETPKFEEIPKGQSDQALASLRIETPLFLPCVLQLDDQALASLRIETSYHPKNHVLWKGSGSREPAD